MRPRKDLSFKDKYELLQRYDHLPKCSTREAALKLEISQTAMSRLLRNREKYEALCQNAEMHGENMNRKRKRGGKSSEVEEALLQWFKDAKALGAPMSRSILTKQAAAFAQQFGVDQFKPTEGWLTRWQTRNNIAHKRKNPDCATKLKSNKAIPKSLQASDEQSTPRIASNEQNTLSIASRKENTLGLASSLKKMCNNEGNTLSLASNLQINLKKRCLDSVTDVPCSKSPIQSIEEDQNDEESNCNVKLSDWDMKLSESFGVASHFLTQDSDFNNRTWIKKENDCDDEDEECLGRTGDDDNEEAVRRRKAEAQFPSFQHVEEAILVLKSNLEVRNGSLEEFCRLRAVEIDAMSRFKPFQ